MVKSMVSCLYLKKVLYSYKMNGEKEISKQLDEFNKLILENINIQIDDED